MTPQELKEKMIEIFMDLVNNFSMIESYEVSSDFIVYYDLSDNFPDDIMMDIKFHSTQADRIEQVKNYINLNLLSRYRDLGLDTELHHGDSERYKYLIFQAHRPIISNAEWAEAIGED